MFSWCIISTWSQASSCWLVSIVHPKLCKGFLSNFFHVIESDDDDDDDDNVEEDEEEFIFNDASIH